ncbi:hypothetical protein F4805DRAFT_436086 [Annulohypoxylon moriforme]|nr:hypothetical protein F4805DRAFT_436086 [Annulohypoxylon moriforme]
MSEQKTQDQSGGSPAKPLLKFSVMHYKKEGVSDEAFKKWFEEEQIPRSISIFKKYNIARYSMFLTPAVLREAFDQELKERRNTNWKMADFSAVTSYWVHDVDDLRNVLSSDEWAEKIAGPETDWVNMESAVVLAGFETVYLEHGEIINTVPDPNTV